MGRNKRIQPGRNLYPKTIAVEGWDELYLHGFANGPNASYSMDGLRKVAGWRLNGTVILSTSTGASTASASVTWSIKGPKTPHVPPPRGVGGATFGGKAVVGVADTESVTSATIGIRTGDGNNFSSGTAVTVAFSASLDEC